MKRFLLGSILALAAVALLPALALGENHGITLTWTASPTAAGCTSPCTSGYQIFEGAGPGLESATPLNSSPVAALTYTDDGPTLNAYLGTTRCYTVQFQEVVSGLTLNSASSNETCFQFPALPLPPGGVAVSPH